jgi:thioredoxin-related protein
MKLTSILIAVIGFVMTIPKWETNFADASQQAQQQHKLVLLNFSGSDWCTPCIRMEKDIFEQTAFVEFSEHALILVKADFPRLKKNRLSKELEQANELLASRYNSEGIFPLTVLLDPQGKVLKSWEGLPKETADEFVKEIDAVFHAYRH